MGVELPAVAASDYLNSAVLMEDFLTGEQRQRCRLITDAAPARCAELLRQGEVVAALIPAIEYQRIHGLLAVPGVSIGSKHTVRSVVMAAKKPLSEIRTVALDTSSRTSVSLVKILFAEFYRCKVTYHPSPPDVPHMLAEADAAVIIGDPALTFDRTGLYVFDLASEWRRLTGLPFVFAIWAVREHVREAVAGLDFVAARDAGLRARSVLAARYAPRLGLPIEALVAYLKENIHYGLEADDLAGLTHYWTLAARHQLIDQVRPLQWLSAPEGYL
ncbi:MAG: menaquinone biosynthetic enzyme MqnA/MqnD family protein [Acidobacteriota bacterium]